MTQKHTTLPWKIDNSLRGYGSNGDEYPATSIINDNGQYVGQTGHQGSEEAQADAAFIVRACNAHDGWRAVKRLIVWLDKNHPEHETMLEEEYENAIARERHPNSEHILAELIEQASAALAKARGQS